MDLKPQFAYHLKTISDLRKSYDHAFKCWVTWNHWGQQQKEYSDWLYENCLEFKDVKAATDRYKKDVEVIFELEEGAAYYANKKLSYHEWEMAQEKFSQFLRSIWFERNGYNDFVYSLEEIAEAWGRTIGSTWGTITRKPWFLPRTEISGRHPSTGWHIRKHA